MSRTCRSALVALALAVTLAAAPALAALASVSGRAAPMARTDHPSAELLARLHPTLERVFAAYGLTARQGDEVVGEAFMTLVSKWPRLDDPERWLLRRILDRCHALAAEAADEDAPE